MVRRVYELDDALIARIAAFRAKIHAGSEVEAVRAIITAGLNSFDTKEDLIARHEGGESSAFFCGHPLVSSLHQEDGALVKVTFRDGSAFEPLAGDA